MNLILARRKIRQLPNGELRCMGRSGPLTLPLSPDGGEGNLYFELLAFANAFAQPRCNRSWHEADSNSAPKVRIADSAVESRK